MKCNLNILLKKLINKINVFQIKLKKIFFIPMMNLKFVLMIYYYKVLWFNIYYN